MQTKYDILQINHKRLTTLIKLLINTCDVTQFSNTTTALSDGWKISHYMCNFNTFRSADHHYVVNLEKNLLYSISSRKSMMVSELPDVSFHNASFDPHLINLKSVKEVIINIFHI